MRYTSERRTKDIRDEKEEEKEGEGEGDVRRRRGRRKKGRRNYLCNS